MGRGGGRYLWRSVSISNPEENNMMAMRSVVRRKDTA